MAKQYMKNLKDLSFVVTYNKQHKLFLKYMIMAVRLQLE